MAKIRKMLGKADSPYIVSIMGLIETQSKNTIVKWCNEYAMDVYEAIAARECKNMEDDLLRVAIEDEPNPAKIKWSC